MASVGRREAPPRPEVQFVVTVGGGWSMCIEIATKREAEEIPSNDWRHAKETPVL